MEITTNSSILCRLCAEVPGTVDLWNYRNKNFDWEILSAIKNHLYIEVYQHDQICQVCLQQVEQWNTFFSKIQKVQDKLKKTASSVNILDTSKEMFLVSEDKSTAAAAAAAASELLDVHYLESVESLEQACDENHQNETMIPLKEVFIPSSEGTFSDANDLNQDNSEEREQNSVHYTQSSVNKKTCNKKNKKVNKKSEQEEENRNNSRVTKAILTYEQVEERMGRSLTEDEVQHVRSLIEAKNNRQIFKFVYGSGDERLWLCHVCNQRVHGRYTELRRHCYEEHHTKLMYNCELCAKKFAYIRQYKRHLEKHFNNNSNLDQDDSKTDSAINLADGNSAQNQTSSGGSFVCEVCGRVLKQKNCLIKHMLTHLPDDRKNVHFCDVCGKGFPALGMLTSHKNRVHIEGRPYTCKTCGKSYKTQRSWKDHCEAHLGNRIFICNVCEMKLSSRQCLKLHMLTHTGEKPFQCDVCHRDYHSKSRMLRHKRITHNPNPQFICDVCGKAFRSRTGIEGHKLEHTGEVNICPICGKAIRAKSNFYAHLKVHRQQASREAGVPVAGKNENARSAKMPKRASKTAPTSSAANTISQDPNPGTTTTYAFSIPTDSATESTYLSQEHIQLPVGTLLCSDQESTTLLTYGTRFNVDCVAGTVAIYASEQAAESHEQQFTYLTPDNPGNP